MASISLPMQSQIPQDLYSSSFRGHTRRNLSMSAPLPNPPFVFPARGSDSTNTTPSPAVPDPATVCTAPPPLPAFSFNPGADSDPLPSPAAAPVNRPTGHRRRPSEFIGGDCLVSPATAETAQPSDETQMQSPDKLPTPGPGFSAGAPGKRRHAHRRSAAISSVDLSAISNALDVKPTLGSAPCVPADRKPESSMYDEAPRPMSHSATLSQRSPPGSPVSPTGGNSPSHSRLTVPTELPTQEEQQTTNTQTVQPEQTARSSTPAPAIEISPSDDQKLRSRPKTADASWLLDQSPHVTTGDTKRPFIVGHSRAHKSLSSGLLDAALRTKDNNDDAHLTDSSRISSDDESDTSVDDPQEQSPKKKSKAKARKKKVRSWAGSILTRGKGKRNQSKETPQPTDTPRPPMITRTNSDLGSGLDVDFDDDNMVVLRTPTNDASAPRPTPAETPAEPQPSLENSWKPKSFYEQGLPNDTSCPVIDLDAALGPFNTPEMGVGQPAASSFSVATKRMYSGGRRGEFVGPEMRYHRRAESAPEMPPIDRGALNCKRLTHHSSLENPDVFDEEEEDAFLAATSEPSPEDERRASQAGSVLVDEDQYTPVQDSSDTLTRPAEDDVQQSPGLGIQRNTPGELSHGPTGSKQHHLFSEQQQVAAQVHNAQNPFGNPPRSPVDVIKQEDWQQIRAPAPPSPDISPRFLPADKRPATSPMELGPPIPAFSLHGSSSHPSSAFPSPDFAPTPTDISRSLATPSTSDRHFFPANYNVSHGSVEDVPSLTSSASTSTNPLQRFSATFFPRRGSSDRAASFSAAVNRRSSASHAAKRSSLASLSKLVPGTHATERSKLSYEEKPPDDVPEKAKKKGRGISRIVQFMKTKDKDKNGDTSQERPT